MRQKRYFQWIAGDNAGNITTLDNITCFDGEYFYNFADGETCNMRFVSPMTRVPKTLEGKVVVEIANPNDPWRIETITTKTYVDPKTNDSYEIPPLADYVKAEGESCEIKDSAVGQMKYTAPRYKGPMRELPNIDDYLIDEDAEYEETTPVEVVKAKPKTKQEVTIEETIVSQVAPEIIQPTIVSASTVEENKSVKNDPVYLIIKNCKKRPTEIGLSLSIDLPSKSVFDMVKDDFEDGDSKFIDCVIEDIDPKVILDAIRGALIEAYDVGNQQ